MSHSNRAILIILDGWGLGTKPEADAIAQADTPFVDSLFEKYPHSTLITFGEEVGLPDGQMGNSEVGHLNIGAGRVVYQQLARINKAIREKTLHHHPKLVAALEYAKSKKQAVHFLGLLSNGGVHSHINHLKALVDIVEENGIQKCFIHAFTDGRDVDPRSGIAFVEVMENYVENKHTKMASVIGRYFAMDRDHRWERIKKAYDLLVNGEGEKTTDLAEAIQQQYDEGTTDEFLLPIVKTDGENNPIATISDDDVVICFNFRTDRPRQITTALTQKNFPEFDMYKLSLHYLTMTRYDASFEKITVLFEKDDIKETLGEVLSKNGKTQVRIAETEKYPHVTFFFSGGRETIFDGERRILIPSPKVATYDLQPQMSAMELTDAIVNDIQDNQPDFICLNYANTDMVGHTGDFKAAIKAAQTVDQCLKKLVKTTLQYNYRALVIADHGNSDYMINDDGSPHTAHTKNLVPCIYIGPDAEAIMGGKLADIAPTILQMMNIPVPSEMTGKCLIYS